ncbi:ogr/Delta-like zinc finger family protein [Serratia marcescens]|uniref:ogr/Delta-like zinc finger family protein n=1 Tax=Serratia marcescens TaxID=615 RepID=UPI0032077CB9
MKSPVTDATKERYHQCTNINCSATFITTETVERCIVKLGEVTPALPHPTRTTAALDVKKKTLRLRG